MVKQTLKAFPILIAEFEIKLHLNSDAMLFFTDNNARNSFGFPTQIFKILAKIVLTKLISFQNSFENYKTWPLKMLNLKM